MSLDRQRIDAVKLLESLGYSYSTEAGWTVPPNATAIKAQFRNERHDLEARLFGILFSAVPKDDATVVELADILAHRLTATVAWLKDILAADARWRGPNLKGEYVSTVQTAFVLARLDPPQEK